MKPSVGIEALAVAVPRRYLALEDLAHARGVDPGKYTQGLGALQMAVPDPGEDAVALAATAARRLLAQGVVDPAKLGMLVVGTETGVDHSKAVASYVQGALGLPRHMRTYDAQHACYGGTDGRGRVARERGGSGPHRARHRERRGALRGEERGRAHAGRGGRRDARLRAAGAARAGRRAQRRLQRGRVRLLAPPRPARA